MAPEPDTISPSSTRQFVTLCHDLRQYLSAGLLLSQMPGDEELGDQVRHRLELIHDQLRSAADLVAATVTDSRPQVCLVDLAGLVDNCVDLVELIHGVSVQTDIAEGAATYGDPVLLRRAVSNLLDNACRAVGPHGQVVVRVGDCGREVWVEVADNGRGFGQISSGTGHGLSIVAAALRACGGRLQISSGPGPGTTVRLAMPTAERKAS